MSTHSGKPPHLADSDAESGFSSNMKLLSIAAAFLIVTIGLIVLQPGLSGPDAQPVAEAPALAPTTSPRPPEVTRSTASPLGAVALPSASEAVSRQLRQPIRLTDTTAAHRDLPSLAAAVLQDFGHRPASDDRLHQLLVQALSERQSNAYIDALLNAAAARGEFAIPMRLERADGRLDTAALLTALVQRSAS
ncbi:MAG: hypothetical protein AAGM84_10220 [Pseudomonadota bacterium]